MYVQLVCMCPYRTHSHMHAYINTYIHTRAHTHTHTHTLQVCMCPDDSFLSSYISQALFAASLRTGKSKSAKKSKKSAEEQTQIDVAKLSAKFKPGDVVEGTLESVKDYGIVVALPHGATGMAPTKLCPQNLLQAKKGTAVSGLVLDVDVVRDIVTLTLDSDLVNPAKGKNKKAKNPLAGVHQSDTVQATVQCVLSDTVVLTLPDHSNALAVAAAQVPSFSCF
jgi:hypothetical protein